MLKMIKRIIEFSSKYKSRIYLAFIFSFLKSMLSQMPIVLAFVMISKYLDHSLDTQAIIIFGGLMVVIVGLQIICQYSADRKQSSAGYEVTTDKRLELGNHLRKLPMGYFTEGNIGKISSILSTDLVFVEETSMTALADLMSDIFSEIILAIFMLCFNPLLGLVTIVILTLIFLVGKYSYKMNIKYSRIRQENSEDLTSSVLDFVEGIGIIKSYNLLGEKSKELNDNFDKSCKGHIKYEQKQEPIYFITLFLSVMGSVILLSLSIYLWFNDYLEAPYLIGMVLFVMNLFMPIYAFYSQIARLTVMTAAMDRIDELLNVEELPNNGKAKLNDNHEIKFNHVTFAYSDKDVLKDISFEMKENTMTALVGPSGGGKSTIANLLTRFWDIKKGSIAIGGVDIRDVPLSELMDNISVVFQRVYLFKDTIYNNINMGRKDATKEEVIKAAKLARCYDFINELPDGFDTVIGEGGTSLSGGEMQRLSIARCILKDAPIIILDEATASVDADNELYIQEAINELCKGKTLLVIAHRLNTIKHADKIIVIRDGQIEEEGSHDELIKHHGLYAEFINLRNQQSSWNSH